jgi:hypothetical protein
MKSILSLIISGALVVLGYAQTRNVLVGTNNAVVQPTNFWSADATNARSGLGLGSAATNPSSAFQPASSILSNLVSGGALTFSNITIGITNVTGLQTALDGKLSTNPTLAISNISNLQTTLDGKLGTNPTLQISNISGLQTNLDSKLSPTGSAANLTNFPTVALASNITGTAALATNVTGVVALVNGGTGATNATGARTALGVSASDVFVGLTNLGTGAGQGFSSSPYILGSTNSTAPNNAVLALGAAGVRSVAGLTLAALTNLDNASFRSAIGLDSSATNASSAFQPSSVVLSNLASSNAVNLTNLRLTNIVGWSAITNTNAATSLLGLTANGQVVANTGTNVLTFTNTSVAFGAGDISIQSQNILWGGVEAINLEEKYLSFDGQEKLRWQEEGVQISVPLTFSGTNTAPATRANLGLGWSALTNSNAGTGLVSVNTNGEVVSPTNFWQASPANTRVQVSQPVVNTTNAATNARNLYFYSLAISTTGVTNTIQLPINGGTFLGDVATIIHEGPTNSVTAVRQTGAGTNLITLNQFQEAVKFIYESGGWRLADNISYVEPIYFSGTNAAANAAASRTNLGLGATWLTNTNVTNFRTAIGLGETNDVRFNSISVYPDGETESSIAAGVDGLVFKYGTNSSFELGGGNDVFYRVPIRFNNTTNAATTRTNLGLGATNNVTFADITLTESGEDDVSVENTSGSIVLRQTTNALVEFGTGASHLFYNAISFNNTTNAAATRTNLGIPLAALTNTSVTNFQKAIFYTNTAPSNIGGNLGTIAAWIEIVASNGVTYKIPAYTNVP